MENHVQSVAGSLLLAKVAWQCFVTTADGPSLWWFNKEQHSSAGVTESDIASGHRRACHIM